MARKAKRGRPRLPKGQSKAALIVLRLQPEDRKTVYVAAKRAGVKFSEWARTALLRAANDGNLEKPEAEGGGVEPHE
jgi:hypothetical protein